MVPPDLTTGNYIELVDEGILKDEEVLELFQANGISYDEADTIIKIAGRSLEFHAINQLLLNNPNQKLGTIQLTNAVIVR